MSSILQWRFIAIVLMLSGTLGAAYVSSDRSPEELEAPLEAIPSQIGAWRGEELGRLGGATEEVLLADAYLNREYRTSSRWARVFVAFYGMQRAGEAMHSPKNCLPGAGWEIWNYGAEKIPVGEREVTVNKYYIQKGPSRMLVYYWYQSPDRIVASEYYAKVCLVWDAVFKGRTSGSIVRILLPDTPGAEKAGAELAGQLIPLVQEVLPQREGA